MRLRSLPRYVLILLLLLAAGLKILSGWDPRFSTPQSAYWAIAVGGVGTAVLLLGPRREWGIALAIGLAASSFLPLKGDCGCLGRLVRLQQSGRRVLGATLGVAAAAALMLESNRATVQPAGTSTPAPLRPGHPPQ